jgi:hypothetical protein
MMVLANPSAVIAALASHRKSMCAAVTCGPVLTMSILGAAEAPGLASRLRPK